MTHLQLPLTNYPPARWRLLLSPPADGATNMAVDEAILNAVAEGQLPPTLRFFAWVPPCFSLGYAQPVADVDLERLRARGWGLVRRPTGGRAILHTDELTYSVIAPMDEPRVLGGVVESYRLLSAGLLRGVERLGLSAQADRKPKSQILGDPRSEAKGTRPKSQDPDPTYQLPITTSNPICFETPSDYEITANGKKLLGSAQVRKRGVVLQHGTLPLTGDVARICEALTVESEAERARLRERVHQRATTIEEILGRPVSWEEAADALRRGFAEALNLILESAPLTPLEMALATKLREEKYATEAWNFRV